MERKDNGVKSLGFSHRLFNFVKNLAFYMQKQVSLGRNSPSQESKPSIRDDLVANGVSAKDMKSRSQHSGNEEGNVPLVPPIITIPVEQQEEMEKASVPMTNVEDKSKDKKKRQSVRIKNGTQEKGALRDYKGQDSRKHDKDDDKAKDKQELKKKASLGRAPSQERNGSEGSAVKPVKPVVRSISNIDKKSDIFIRERKELFAGTL